MTKSHSINEHDQYTIFLVMIFRRKHSDNFVVSWLFADYKDQGLHPGTEIVFNSLFRSNFIYHHSILLHNL